MSEFEDKIVKGKKFERMLQLFWENIPGDIDLDVLEDSLRHCAGSLMTKELLRDTCWRIAGNIPRLKDKRAVPPWHVQKLPEWVPVQVVGCRPERNKSGRLGSLFEFRVVGGTPCPRCVFKFWSARQAVKFAKEGFGFSRNVYGRDDPAYPFQAPSQLVNLRAYVLLEPEMCGKELGFEELDWPSAVKNWNKQVLKLRFRTHSREKCPNGFPDEFPCHHCAVGFYSCLAGCHRHDWTVRPCKECGNKEALFDPEIKEKICIDCYDKKRTKR
jgi:hypothetical protein